MVRLFPIVVPDIVRSVPVVIHAPPPLAAAVLPTIRLSATVSSERTAKRPAALLPSFSVIVQPISSARAPTTATPAA